MTYYKKEILCHTEKETKLLAEKVASLSRRGDVFALYGTLGVGKSTFSRYFIQFLSNATDVPSPTFTLLQTYETLTCDIYHYDMYRIKSSDEAYELGVEDAFYDGICLIEWPEKIATILPKDIWKITITAQGNIRQFCIEVINQEKGQRLEEI